MILHDSWLLLLPLAAASGWLAAIRHFKQPVPKLPPNYLVGLNFLLNEEPDKAIDTFIQMLKIDSETVETHLALGNLFRRRGEVDRAIRIHQNLTARPNLAKAHRIQALKALALDYLSAGMLDQSEKLFLELIHLADSPADSYRHLLSIYQQEKDWHKAIATAKKLKKYNENNIEPTIAHYYCELANQHLKEKNLAAAVRLLKKALSTHRHCARANLLLGKIYIQSEKYRQAIKTLEQIEFQNIALFPETIKPLAKAYCALGKEKKLIEYLKNILGKYPQTPIITVLSEEILKWRDKKIATEFITNYVRKYPSIRGLKYLIELYLPATDETVNQDLLILKSLIQNLLGKQSYYQCTHCGFKSNTLYWQCPSCQKWDTVKPFENA